MSSLRRISRENAHAKSEFTIPSLMVSTTVRSGIISSMLNGFTPASANASLIGSVLQSNGAEMKHRSFFFATWTGLRRVSIKKR